VNELVTEMVCPKCKCKSPVKVKKSALLAMSKDKDGSSYMVGTCENCGKKSVLTVVLDVSVVKATVMEDNNWKEQYVRDFVK
jgi:RNase P subunit RPR2